MPKKPLIDKIPEIEYYMTGGIYLGRVLACKKPFYRGKGVYHFSMDLSQWEVKRGKKLTEEQLLKIITEIRDAKVANLREAVRLNPQLGVTLVEDPPWVFRLVEK